MNRLHFFSPFSRGVLSLIIGLILHGPAWSRASNAEGKLPEFRQVLPLKNVREAAQSAGFNLTGFAQPRAGKLRQGDTATLLVSLSTGAAMKQWIIEMEMDESTKAETKQARGPIRFHTSTGNEFTLGGGQAALKLRVMGPIIPKDNGKEKVVSPRVEHRRVLVSPDYQGLGLEKMPAMMLRLENARLISPAFKSVQFEISTKPYPKETLDAVRKQRALTDKSLRTSKSDEIGFIGSMLAMQEFFVAANSIPGVQDIVRSVIDVPWLSIIGSGGRADIKFMGLPAVAELENARWGLPPGDKIYSMPFRLEINNKQASLLQIAVTRPKPPLMVTAGAVGFAAGFVNGRGPVLTFQVVSTRTK